jgi:uncharacterized protein
MRKFAILISCLLLSAGFMLAPNVRADMDSGLMAYANGDFDTAAREFLRLSEQGDKSAQYHMGLLYEEGQGVAQQMEKAIQCYRKAAEQGYVDAYFALGEIYLRQPGGQKDRIKAFYWLGLAAKHGHPRGEEEFRRNRKAMTSDQISIAERTVPAAP